MTSQPTPSAVAAAQTNAVQINGSAEKAHDAHGSAHARIGRQA
jgi:hypothetical protein